MARRRTGAYPIAVGLITIALLGVGCYTGIDEEVSTMCFAGTEGDEGCEPEPEVDGAWTTGPVDWSDPGEQGPDDPKTGYPWILPHHSYLTAVHAGSPSYGRADLVSRPERGTRLADRRSAVTDALAPHPLRGADGSV